MRAIRNPELFFSRSCQWTNNDQVLESRGHYSKIWKCFHVNILWKLGEWVLFNVLKNLVHAYSFMWTHCEQLGNVYYPESRTVLFTFTTMNIPWSCS